MAKEEIYFRGRITNVEQDTCFGENGQQTTTSKIYVKLFRGARTYQGRKIKQVTLTYSGPISLRERDEIRFSLSDIVKTDDPYNLEGRAKLITRSDSKRTFARYTSTQ